MEITANYYMDLALNEAWRYQILTYPNPAVGSVIVKNNSILSISAHKKAGEPHAEVNAIKEAYYKLTLDSKILEISDSTLIHEYLYKNHNNLFIDSSIYVTLEPCHHYGKTPPCSLLIERLKFKKVYIALRDINPKASGSIEFLKNSKIDVEVGICEDKAKELLYPFMKWLNGKFIFFKFAQSLNGVITGGYISNRKSLELVHKMRDKISLLTIGGNTVRIDRPTLDCRFMENGKNPDIFIYSKSDNFDKTIPLFDIKDRDITIGKSLEDIFDKHNLIMIEGGESMIRATRDIIDSYLIFVAEKYIDRKSISLDLNLSILNIERLDDNLKFWAKAQQMRL
jgi:diaminohydroxyphosphoribosylaminopyrimidine deaminase/5-amino-6-(5-phosphoribosylamino)uracil reductase